MFDRNQSYIKCHIVCNTDCSDRDNISSLKLNLEVKDAKDIMSWVSGSRRYRTIKLRGGMEADDFDGPLSLRLRVGDVEKMMSWASRKGSAEVVELCKRMNASSFNEALRCAAGSGHIELAKMFKDWGLTLLLCQCVMRLTVDMLRLSSYAKSGGQTITTKS